MDFPQVSVLIVTYDRPVEIRRTVYALLKHIKYPRDKLLWHICDDGTPGLYLDNIKREFKFLRFTATVTDRKGFGANVNKGFMFCLDKSDYVFAIEDDRPPKKTFDLERAVAVLSSTEDNHRPEAATRRKPIGCCRLDGISGHWFHLELRDAKTEMGTIPYLRVLHSSPHLNVYSNRPAIYHRRYRDYYGILPEGYGLADTETIYAHNVKGKKDKVWTVLLSDGIEMSHEHIGQSRQGSKEDVNYKSG